MANSDRKKVTVLRLKRKRTEDPLQTLFVRGFKGKRLKQSDCCVEGKDNAFNLVATTTAGAESCITDLNEEAIRKIYEESKCKDDNAEAKADESWDSMKTQMKTSNFCSYKITSAQAIKELSSCCRFEEDEDKIEREIFLEVFDIAKDERNEDDVSKELIGYEKDGKTNFNPIGNDGDLDEILCNSMKLVREKLTISDDSIIQDPEYVYDLYYAQAINLDTNQPLLLCHTLNPDSLFNAESADDLENPPDDEDDSNDESNWRNDYPDEDECFSSNEDEASSYSDDNSSNTEDFRLYRTSCDSTFCHPFSNEPAEQYNFQAYDELYDDYDHDYAS